MIAAADYDPEADPDNTPDSVFCAHGGGFTVKWDKVPEYMHLPGCLEKPREDAPVRRRCIRLDDAELEAIMTREFGPVRRPLYREPEKREAPADTGLREIGQRCYVVDGYNVIFDWEELHALADRDLSAARERLMDTLCSTAFIQDAHRSPSLLHSPKQLVQQPLFKHSILRASQKGATFRSAPDYWGPSIYRTFTYHRYNDLMTPAARRPFDRRLFSSFRW